jgi:hypothetical protein
MTAPNPYDGAGSLFALAIRVTLLDAPGAPLVGEQSSYISDALVKAEIGLTYNETEQVTQLNGTGVACVNYQAPASVQRGALSGLVLCQPDPVLKKFLLGGDLIMDAGSPANPIGYRAPLANVPQNPNGMSIEFWSRAMQGSSFAASLPFIHWVLPKCTVVPSGTWALAADAAMTPEFEGYSEQNTGWGSGPEDDWDYPSDRVWQYARVATLPNVSRRWIEVEAA